MAGIAFWGSKTGQKQGGCCLNARTAKNKRKMLKLRKFPTDWMLETNWNGVQKPIQNRWKFNICFNVWIVFRLIFAVRASKQRPPCFWPVFKPQNAIRPLHIIRDYFLNYNDILISDLFILMYRPYIFISYITFQHLSFKRPRQDQNISKNAVVLRDYCPTSHQTWKDLVKCSL